MLPHAKATLFHCLDQPAPFPSAATLHHAAAGRFSLTLKLLGSGVRPVLESLFAGLAAAVAAAAGHAAGEDQNEHSPPGREQAPAQEQGQAPGVMCSAEQLSALRAVYGLPS